MTQTSRRSESHIPFYATLGNVNIISSSSLCSSIYSTSSCSSSFCFLCLGSIFSAAICPACCVPVWLSCCYDRQTETAGQWKVMEPRTQNIWNCKLCDLKMQTNTVSKHHIIQDHEFVLHHCELCDSKSKQLLIQRIIFMSMKPFNHNYKICDRRIKTKTDPKYHIRDH